jgi:hypothetical protein
MGLEVEIMLPLKYYKERIAEAKTYNGNAQEVRRDIQLAQREREINKQASMDRNARANAADLKAGSAMGGAKPPKPMKKPEMMYGGMANNKKHMYAAGGSVQDNPGLKALAKKRPDVVKKMGYNV